jgi:micrococcal nuclease
MLRARHVVPILCLLILLPFILHAREPVRTEEGIVRHVADGDTVTLITGTGAKLRIRLYGIDAPETEKINRRTGMVTKPGQPYGEEAHRVLEGKVLHKRITVQILDIDRYHRIVAVLYLGDRDVNREMVRQGFAWAYREYLHAPYASEYIEAESEARKDHIGLWQQMNPQPPWEFRRALRIR